MCSIKTICSLCETNDAREGSPVDTLLRGALKKIEKKMLARGSRHRQCDLSVAGGLLSQLLLPGGHVKIWHTLRIRHIHVRRGASKQMYIHWENVDALITTLKIYIFYIRVL